MNSATTIAFEWDKAYRKYLAHLGSNQDNIDKHVMSAIKDLHSNWILMRDGEIMKMYESFTQMIWIETDRINRLNEYYDIVGKTSLPKKRRPGGRYLP